MHRRRRRILGVGYSVRRIWSGHVSSCFFLGHPPPGGLGLAELVVLGSFRHSRAGGDFHAADVVFLHLNYLPILEASFTIQYLNIEPNKCINEAIN